MALLLWLALGGCDAERPPVETGPSVPETVPPVALYDCAASEVTWENWAGPFFTTWCTPCHSVDVVGDMRKGAPDRANFDEYAEVLPFLGAIAIAVPATDVGEFAYPRRMPPGGGVPDASKALLAEWIACGAAEGEPPAVEFCAEISVVPGDLTLDSQAAIDGFCAAGNAVGGDLVVSAPGELVLDCLCEVQGDVLVGAGPTTRVDLPELRVVGGSIEIANTTQLTAFVANAVEAVPGDVTVAVTSGLTEVNLLAATLVGGDLQFLDNDDLFAVDLQQVESIGAGINLNGNPALQVVYLMGIRTVADEVVVKFNGALTDILAFDSLETVGGSLVIDHNRGLESLSWFQELRTVGGDLEITENEQLAEIFGFWLLDEIGGTLDVHANPALTSALGMELLRTAGSISLADNAALTELAFPALTTVGAFTLANNDALVTFDGPLALTDVGLFTLDDNDALTQVNGFDAVLSSDGVVISGNDALTFFRGFPLLTAMDGGFVLLDNPLLANVGSWPSLEEIRGTLRLENLDALATTAGLEQDTIVETDLHIIGNATLEDLDGQAGLDVVGAEVEIRDNPMLPQSAIDAVVDGLSVLGGPVVISGNGG